MRRFPSILSQFDFRLQSPSLFAVGMLIGAIWYYSIPFEPPIWGIVVAWGMSVLLLTGAVLSAQLANLFSLAILAVGTMTGAASGSFATLRLEHTTIEQPLGPVLVEGWIERIEPAKRGVRLVIKTHAVDGLDRSERPKRIRLTHISQLQTESGRFVRCWSVLRPPPAPIIESDYAFDRQAYYAGLGAVGYVQGRCRGGAVGTPASFNDQMALRVAEARRSIARYVNAAAGDRAGGFAAALASGDRSLMPQADQDALRASGLAHLLAISGLHMGIVGGLVFLILWRGLALIEPLALRWTVKKPAAFGAILACAGYLVISGASVSTQRAFIMAVVLFGAVLIDRVALTLRSLAVAMSLIVLIAPWSVLTPGFQMSFAATAALIIAYERWQARRRSDPKPAGSRILFWVKSLVVTSVVSSLATMPFALFHFNRVAGLGILANLLAMPIISLVSAPLAALALILTPIGLDAPIWRAFGLSLEAVLAIAHWSGAFRAPDIVHWPRMPGISLVLLSAGLIALGLSRTGRRALPVMAGLVVLAIAFWGLSARERIHWAPSGEVFLEYASGEVLRVAFIEGEGLGPLQFADVSTSGSCEDALACHPDLTARGVHFVPEGLAPDCATLASARLILTATDLSDCSLSPNAAILHWADVVQENGITLGKRGSAFDKTEKFPCGRRAWRPCRVAIRISE